MVLLSACNTLPDLPQTRQTGDENADYPSFVPITDVVLKTAQEVRDAQPTEEALAARAANLRARAARLRAPKIQ